jgi:hypothetical protein
MQPAQILEMLLFQPRQKEHVTGFVMAEKYALPPVDLVEIGVPAA